jgi:hypothetical protein
METPIDKTTIWWDSPFIHAATFIYPHDMPEWGQNAYGENLSFNIWHILETPDLLEYIGKTYKVVYEASAIWVKV